MTCFALSSLWFNYINSFEDFVEDADRTYLLSEGSAKFQPDCADYGVRDAIAEKIEALKKYCPEIEELYVWYPDGVNFKDVDDIIQIDYGPSNLCKVLNLNILSGRGELLAPDEILVPRKWAIDKLGQEDVVGRSLTRLDWSNRPVEEVKIVGVFEDMPGNSALFPSDMCFGLWNGMSPSVYRVVLWAKLYEGVDLGDETVGLISYMRTDSIRLSDEFVKSTYVDMSWRHQYVGAYKTVIDGINFVLIDNEQYFGRDAFYGYADDGDRVRAECVGLYR